MALKPQKAMIEHLFDSRGHSRRKLLLEVNAQALGPNSGSATVHDVSESGLLIELSSSLAVGDVIEVEFPQARLKLAEVVWTSGQLAGCKFVEQLTSGSISAALLRSAPTHPGSGAAAWQNDAHSDFTAIPTSPSEPSRLSGRAKILTVFGLTSLMWTLIIAAGFLVLSN